MRNRNFIIAICVFTLCFSLVSAGLFDDIFKGITGNTIAETEPEEFGEEELTMITCEEVKVIFNKDFSEYEIPKAVPFKTEVFNVHIDNEFFISANLEEGKIKLISCEESEEPTYNVYIKSKLILDAIEDKDGIKPLDFYNDNRKNGQLEIKPIGITRKLKMSFINFGLKIASWFD